MFFGRGGHKGVGTLVAPGPGADRWCGPADCGLLAAWHPRAIVVGVLTAVMATALAGAPGLAAPAAPAERAEVLLLSGAINRYLAKQLPSTFTLRGVSDAGVAGPAVTLVAARSCEAKDAGRGRLVGVVRPAGTVGSAVALEAADCRRKPSEIRAPALRRAVGGRRSRRVRDRGRRAHRNLGSVGAAGVDRRRRRRAVTRLGHWRGRSRARRPPGPSRSSTPGDCVSRPRADRRSRSSSRCRSRRVATACSRR